MRISVETNVREVIGWLNRVHPQAQFAIAKALSDTVVEIQRALPDEANRSFEGGATQWTRRGFEFKRATKANLTASVSIRPQQAQYLQFQVEGGTRQPRNLALRLPSNVQLDRFGNLPAGAIRQLVAQANAGKRATRRQAKRFGVSTQVDLFYGDPGDGRPAGIYKRVVVNATTHRLVPVVVFPRRAAHYRDKPFDFYGFSERMALRNFERNLDRAWRYALATAR